MACDIGYEYGRLANTTSVQAHMIARIHRRRPVIGFKWRARSIKQRRIENETRSLKTPWVHRRRSVIGKMTSCKKHEADKKKTRRLKTLFESSRH